MITIATAIPKKMRNKQSILHQFIWVSQLFMLKMNGAIRDAIPVRTAKPNPIVKLSFIIISSPSYRIKSCITAKRTPFVMSAIRHAVFSLASLIKALLQYQLCLKTPQVLKCLAFLQANKQQAPMRVHRDILDFITKSELKVATQFLSP